MKKWNETGLSEVVLTPEQTVAAFNLRDRVEEFPLTASREIVALRAALEQAEKERAALREIADDGCGFVSMDGDQCQKLSDDHGDWCWSCVAAAALSREVARG